MKLRNIVNATTLSLIAITAFANEQAIICESDRAGELAKLEYRAHRPGRPDRRDPHLKMGQTQHRAIFQPHVFNRRNLHARTVRYPSFCGGVDGRDRRRTRRRGGDIRIWSPLEGGRRLASATPTLDGRGSEVIDTS